MTLTSAFAPSRFQLGDHVSYRGNEFVVIAVHPRFHGMGTLYDLKEVGVLHTSNGSDRPTQVPERELYPWEDRTDGGHE